VQIWLALPGYNVNLSGQALIMTDGIVNVSVLMTH